MTRQSRQNSNDRKVIEEFAARRANISKIAVLVGIIAGATVILFYAGLASNVVAGSLLVVFSIAAFFVNIKLWRCPSCNGHLGRLYLGLKQPMHCPNCGIRLVER